jgi:hypothetical protein
MQVRTRSYPALIPIYELFYKKVNGKLTKTITYDLVHYIDEAALAY